MFGCLVRRFVGCQVLLSIPGTWYGMPTTSLFLLPLLLSILECQGLPECQSSADADFGTKIVLFVAVGMVAGWFAVCYESAGRASSEHTHDEWCVRACMRACARVCQLAFALALLQPRDRAVLRLFVVVCRRVSSCIVVYRRVSSCIVVYRRCRCTACAYSPARTAIQVRHQSVSVSAWKPLSRSPVLRHAHPTFLHRHRACVRSLVVC